MSYLNSAKGEFWNAPSLSDVNGYMRAFGSVVGYMLVPRGWNARVVGPPNPKRKRPETCKK